MAKLTGVRLLVGLPGSIPWRNMVTARAKVFAVAVMLLGLTASPSATALTYYFTDWKTWNPAEGWANGVISIPNSSDVTVTFNAIKSNGTAGTYLGVWQDPGIWTPASTYTSSQVTNAPTFEAVQLVGENNMTYRVTLSEPIKDPLMDVVTLGQLGIPATYVFNAPFTILSQGPNCCWGSGTTTLTQLNSNTLQGIEGSGTLQFIGTYSTFSWTMPNAENWHGFTFGVRTTLAIEPDPPSGVPEPSSLALLGFGLAGLAAIRRRTH